MTALMLPATTRRLHRLLMEGVLATGTAPAASALASALDLELDALRAHLQTLERADYLGLDETSHLTCLYPFSLAPTPNLVTIGETTRFAMCSLDALGMAAMLGREVAIASACPVCNVPIRLTVAPGNVAHVAPAATVVVAGRDADLPAHEVCCGVTVFACGPEHAALLAPRTPNSSVLDLVAAQAIGEAIFAGMLADSLPARRPRAAHAAHWPA